MLDIKPKVITNIQTWLNLITLLLKTDYTKWFTDKWYFLRFTCGCFSSPKDFQ